MGFSLAVNVLLVFSCISQIRGVTVVESVEQDSVPEETYKLRISERGARFKEKVQIDKKKDIEYFKVPAHNELSETDNLYDFKMNITVSRVKKDRVCHITPLPADLPRPNVLSKELKSMSKSRPNRKIEKTTQLWTLGEKVDKSTLRKEVRDFCGKFPVYRLKRYTPPDTASASNGDEPSRAGRKKRDMDFPLCENVFPPCGPNLWVYTCKIRTSRCVYYVKCKLNAQQKILSCSQLMQHLYSSLVCCTPKCPSG